MASSPTRRNSSSTGSRGDASRAHTNRWIAVGVAAAMAIAVIGLVLTLDGPDTAGSGEGATMAHVHGLGVDPADDTLYAGTHYGLFRIGDDGTASLVADRVQDFMGFTVAGPGRFLASGHPGEGQDAPASLGLIESTDRGETWESRSLAGDADFHSLEFRHDRVYGLNSLTGQLMVSDDMESWEPRSSAPIADFAVSPEDPDTILATTENGPAISADGGGDFRLLPDSPVLLLVSWADDGTAVGISPEGVVHTSDDPLAGWTERASLDAPPAALTVEGSAIYAAAGGTVLVSEDGGDTFSTLYAE